jgi:hypothetical protein
VETENGGMVVIRSSGAIDILDDGDWMHFSADVGGPSRSWSMARAATSSRASLKTKTWPNSHQKQGCFSLDFGCWPTAKVGWKTVRNA